MYSLPYLTDISYMIDRKIKEDPDFYDNVRVRALKDDIRSLLNDMRKWVDKKDRKQLLGKNKMFLPEKTSNQQVDELIQRHSEIIETAKRLGVYEEKKR